MLVSFYGKSSLKLVFTEACSQWDGICCHFVLIFKEDFYLCYMVCVECFACMCFCAQHACSAHGGQERASEPPELKWVWELSPGPPPGQQVPLNTESSLQPVLAF